MTIGADNNVRQLTDLFKSMHRIRAFEQTALEAHRAGEMPGPLHVSIGQEAVAAGVCANLHASDRITSNHRGHGHVLAKGGDPLPMYLELFGRDGGYCRGKGGSMHIADFSIGMLGANGVVAGGIPIAVGAAQGLKLLNSDAVVVCFFGDGAVNRGPFLEGLNWAALYQLPVLFVCEDNGVAAFTPAQAVTAGEGAAARAMAIGVEAAVVDGNDSIAVADSSANLLEEIRNGQGPRLLQAKTYRWMGHTSTDPAAWRDKSEVEAWKKRCPIVRLSRTLTEQGITPAELTAIATAAHDEMRTARSTAGAAPWPVPATAYEDILDTGKLA
ncbi:MAG: thiamine pyrophosphate-dependent dehydrogenase E1 component subunit alpha [Hyphomicrobiaceae bacterium]